MGEQGRIQKLRRRHGGDGLRREPGAERRVRHRGVDVIAPLGLPDRAAVLRRAERERFPALEHQLEVHVKAAGAGADRLGGGEQRLYLTERVRVRQREVPAAEVPERGGGQTAYLPRLRRGAEAQGRQRGLDVFAQGRGGLRRDESPRAYRGGHAPVREEGPVIALRVPDAQPQLLHAGLDGVLRLFSFPGRGEERGELRLVLRDPAAQLPARLRGRDKDAELPLGGLRRELAGDGGRACSGVRARLRLPGGRAAGRAEKAERGGQRREDKAAACKTFHFSSLLGRHLSTARIMEIPPFVKPAGRGA